ncbi:ankyrin repeat domain-containing protein 39-like [Penaeus chinensis]|uniref:ankyrin repeat domain-containing protein 39-like n=1 Tax=Penaeus chinensis TaxID=139456 RepID=UPI001FB59CA4|nr:ankyrin repeat domain-containing protein 39-like [Penaeus chinensis]
MCHTSLARVRLVLPNYNHIPGHTIYNYGSYNLRNDKSGNDTARTYNSHNHNCVTGVTALTAAAANGHYAVVEYLLSQGASVDKPNTNQFTALMEAARAKHIDILRLLIDNGADLEVARTNALYLADKTTENHSCASATGAQQL